MAFNPTEYKVISFDVYGTLIDWEAGISESLVALFSKLPVTSPHHPSQNSDAENRSFILGEFTKIERAVQSEQPTLVYPKVLATSYERLATQMSIPLTSGEASEFGSAVGTWSAFPDTVAALQILGTHYKLVVLSNVDKESFSRSLSGPLKGAKFDAIYTAEDIGSYKPDLRNFQYLVDHAGKDFGAKKEEILKVAQSLSHDHIPAKEFGLPPSIWIKRDGQKAGMGGKYDDVKDKVQLAGAFDTLGDFAEVVKKGFGDSD